MAATFRRGLLRGAVPRLAAAAAAPVPQRRTFLPGLSRLLKTSEQRRRTEQWQRVLQHPVEDIYGVVADVGAYAEFLPWCLSSRVLERRCDATGAGSLSTEVSVGFEILKSSFCSEVSLQPCTRIHAVSEENEYMEQLAFTWEFTPISERSCRLDLGLDFTLRSAEHVLLWELSQEQIIAKYVGCFTKRCADVRARRAGDGDAGDGAADAADAPGGAQSPRTAGGAKVGD